MPVLEASLSPDVRLALAYAPTGVRPIQLAAFALDAKLAGIVGHAREVLLAQICGLLQSPVSGFASLTFAGHSGTCLPPAAGCHTPCRSTFGTSTMAGELSVLLA